MRIPEVTPEVLEKHIEHLTSLIEEKQYEIDVLVSEKKRVSIKLEAYKRGAYG